MTDKVIDIILEPCASYLHFLDFLVRREIDLFFDTINRIVEPMIFVEHRPEVIVAAFEAADDFTMLRELSQNGMMKIHMV